MVGLVIVSHSHQLAQAALHMAMQMITSPIKAAIAAGVGEEHQELGTDATDIARAIQEVDAPEGVLVFMDLGSALLSAEMALQLLPEDIASRTKLSPGPIVEGLIPAAIQAALGGDLDTVYREAAEGLKGKQQQLGIRPPEDDGTFPEQATAVDAILADEASSAEFSARLENPHGLHARPAAKFIRLAKERPVEVLVWDLSSGRGPARGDSLTALTSLGASEGHVIKVRVRGPGAKDMIGKLQSLVQTGFGEIGRAAAPALEPEVGPLHKSLAIETSETLQGIPASEGYAIGMLFFLEEQVPLDESRASPDPQWERTRLLQAIEKAKQSLHTRQANIRAQLGEEAAAIFEAYQLLLDDVAFLDTVFRGIDEGNNAALAWTKAIEDAAEQLDRSNDEYLKARAIDLRDVGRIVKNAMSVGNSEIAKLSHPMVACSHEITANQVADLGVDNLLGVVAAGGSPNSHAAILLRGLGIPAVFGVNIEKIRRVEGEVIVGLDGGKGQVWINPAAEKRAFLENARAAWLESRGHSWREANAPAITRDGKKIMVAANVGSEAEAAAAFRSGAEGIGVLRTEFLFLHRKKPPTELEQLVALELIGEKMGGRPVVVRTLDAGGDKELPYLHRAQEANPFLGVRAIRLSLQEKALFLDQLRAILRAGAKYPIKILLPLITDVAEVEQATEMIRLAHAQLENEGLSHVWPVEMGVMVETPAAAMLVSRFVPWVDFFSIGTNDLTQYTLAAERGNPELSGYQDSLHPAVLRLIWEVVEEAHRGGKWASVCGEIAADLEATPILLGLAVDELSLNPVKIPEIKSFIRQLDLDECKDLSKRAISLKSAHEVRSLITKLKKAIASK